ncbi:glycoside hydrolase family 32 protein [Spiroplasma turonicum]|uniref:beta-fructofuranosidase n=1 Tax=Spiroplasma turonicum TaxID=216946 RepID=A0A0K1P5W5_9MOLU|nr:glycoside hydrolase family 32 protein [Spiroplasma turonicum]AKU79696.1 sucrose-6-phosphate hydrolase [Spiroplasma turonicum]ALX70714.1 sucrose-6-phosphate hydrolase [Spiroplasma turonicum]
MKWEKHSLISEDNLEFFKEWHEKKESDWYNNQFHLSGYCGSINDPNGLVFFDNKYYIFMQNCPFSIQHYNKSWALFTTHDFINYNYEGITLTPSNQYDKDGVFSGSARVNNKGEMEIYYTGNIKYNAIDRNSYTLKAFIDLKNKLVSKELLFECDKTKYTGHFRDPIVFEKNNKLFMLNGAQTLDKKGTLTVHEFVNDKWVFKKEVELDKDFEQNSYMVECPNYLKIDNSEFVFACFEQDAPLSEGSHFVKYRKVVIDENANFNFKTDLLKIDLGFDFYAPQVFSNVKDRTIMLGWLGNSKSNPFPKELTTWSNNLTSPRVLTEKNNRLYQNPIVELENLRVKEITKSENDYLYENGIVELVCDEINNQDFEIEIKSGSKNIKLSNINKKFIIDRSNMDYNSVEDLPPVINFDNLSIDNIRILIDRSCMEIFINNGEHAISLRTFILNHNTIKTNLNNSKVYQLKGYNINWNNTIFKNITKEK